MPAVFSILALLMLATSALAGTTSVTGYIGSHKITYKAESIAKVEKLQIKGSGNYLAVTEVYPDTPEQVRYDYKLSGDSLGEYRRSINSLGFGPVTYFVPIKKNPAGLIKIANNSDTPVLISSIRCITQSELDDFLKNDKFIISGLLPPGATQSQNEEWMAMLAQKLKNKPDAHISNAFSYEIRYACGGKEYVKAQIDTCLKWSKQYNLPAVLGMVSWWSGTPSQIEDGLGGKFGDISYQQVCYSPDTEVPENPELKKMLGSRYNSHYSLSVPNQWSSCPWLTMNSDRLNRYRYKRMEDAAELIKEMSINNPAWINSLYMENEPRYWDTECEAGNNKSHKGMLWADFNPLVIAAAKKDGVNLDPSDGLSNEELSWLHRNIGKYNQETIDAMKTALSGFESGAKLPVYTHSLQHKNMFPGGPINHPASEWAYADNARSGIEGIWSQPSDFYRVREWGRWANVNREENDGMDIDVHLWDLRVAYMMGADIYNSYNWQAIGAQRFFDYVDEFLKEFPVVTLPQAEVNYIAADTITIKTPLKLQAFTHIELPIISTAKASGKAYLSILDEKGNIIAVEQKPVNLEKSRQIISFNFVNPVESKWSEKASMKLHFVDVKGKALNIAAIPKDCAKDIKLSLNLRAQRALSLAVINSAKR